MYRRLFFLFPSRKQTNQAVLQLEDMGIKETDIHAFSADKQELAGLPPASDRQKRGLDVLVEKVCWNADLILFFIALAGFGVALFYSSLGWAALALIIMALTFSAGYVFATRIPKAHVTDFRDALRHHEILLSVDVPPGQVAAVSSLMHRGHPEVVDGGVGWSLHRFGL
ncbi:hypothetical protein SAMN05660964_00773 [Thiothrix caldifontis]|uniref:Uncharacterized protein n=1 Tax=Thiothrix caldifontis TaxID=525918 RepID=A0A1H3XSU3_9GAMM|nr:hypothetical protein [Thiothrix caldifontis]SEA01622.1 hypothetical protein SAMN05660964_00773 [Thiothrix caldifontis]